MDDQRVIVAQLNVEHFRALLTTEPKAKTTNAVSTAERGRSKANDVSLGEYWQAGDVRCAKLSNIELDD